MWNFSLRFFSTFFMSCTSCYQCCQWTVVCLENCKRCFKGRPFHVRDIAWVLMTERKRETFSIAGNYQSIVSQLVLLILICIHGKLDLLSHQIARGFQQASIKIKSIREERVKKMQKNAKKNQKKNGFNATNSPLTSPVFYLLSSD